MDARPHRNDRLPKVTGAHLSPRASPSRSRGVLVCHDGVTGVRLANDEVIDASAVVLAPHFRREIVWAAREAGAHVVAKPFAMGVRIEHPQASRRMAPRGPPCPRGLRVVEQVGFLCPGGVMVPASTVPGQQVVNGWSPARRKGRFANSGFVTEIGQTQLADAGLDPARLDAGLELQRTLEQRAFAAGGGAFVAPAQTLRDLVDGRAGHPLPDASYHRGLRPVDLRDVLGPLASPLRRALEIIETRMPGFVTHDAVAVGVESRTSSPVRLERDRETLEAVGLRGLYPCGEGAGYAGGIISAARLNSGSAAVAADAKLGLRTPPIYLDRCPSRRSGP